MARPAFAPADMPLLAESCEILAVVEAAAGAERVGAGVVAIDDGLVDDELEDEEDGGDDDDDDDDDDAAAELAAALFAVDDAFAEALVESAVAISGVSPVIYVAGPSKVLGAVE
jgi:hypothetical protein